MSSSGNETSPEPKPRSKKKAFLFLGVLLLLAIGSVAGTSTGLITNVAEESRTFPIAGQERAESLVIAVAHDMPRWTVTELISRRGAPAPMRFEARTRLVGFVDDVTITAIPVDSSTTTLRVRSASRVGLSDFGTNRRRIHEFFDRVEEKLRQ